MTLVVCGQDITRLELALLDGSSVVQVKTVAAPPEQYLSTIAKSLAAWNIDPADLTELIVVSGPGAFTSSRLSTTLVNTFGFVHNIPLFSVANEERLPLAVFIENGALAKKESVRYAQPVYDRPPNITLPRPVK